jgi:hypothetical protein
VLTLKQRTIVIYHATGGRVVALLEIVSPSNKHSRQSVQEFLGKALAAISQGYHLVVIDLFAPGRHDPAGLHGEIWEAITGDVWQPFNDQPLSVASYCAKTPPAAYVDPLNIGQTLPQAPLFFTTDRVNVSLEDTYMAAYRGVPERWKRVLEGQ